MVINSATLLSLSGNFKFDWITGVYLAILLIGLIIGINKGFISSLLSFFGLIIAVVVAALLAGIVGNWIRQISGWGTAMTDSINSWITGKAGSSFDLTTVLSKADLTTADASGKTVLATILGYAGIPINLDFTNNLVLSTVEANPTVGIGQCISLAITNLAFTAIGFVVVLLLMLIVIAILKHITKNINKIPVAGSINKFLGAIFGLAIGAVIVVVISYGLNMLPSGNDAYNFISDTICLSDNTHWTLAEYLYTENFLTKIIAMIHF